ncbi:tetratricopeptide repeat protein, partial [bacterium]|nr:tetratricopeptide repeat protein [bacterium]
MNKKSMFLLALALLLTGVSFEKSPVSAKENKYSSGAIIEQLTQDNTKELSKIWENFGSKDKYFDRQIALIEYYENIANIGKVSDLFFETLAEIKDIENNAKKKEAINKLTTYIQDCVNNQPFNSRYLYYLSKIEKELINDSENAYNLLQQALNFDKTNPVYLFEKAQYELNNNNYKKAIRIMEALKRNYPRELDYRIGLAKAYTQEGSYDAAIKEYRVAAVFEPDNNDTIIALNDLTQYSKIAKHSGGVFYDPMTAVKPAASPKGEKLVAFNSQTNQTLKSTSSNIQKATVVSQAYRPQNVNTTSLQNISTNKPQKVQKSIPSSKRVMVSYVNGRKVVKIVNINSNTDTTQTLQNASETFSTQLESANSGYKTTQTASNKEQYSLSPSKKQSTVGSMESTTFEKPVSNTSYTDTTKSKYSINENISTQKIEKTTDYSQPLGKIETNNNNGDPSVKALNYNPSKKQLLVTYQNGKRVVKMVSPNTTPNQEINKNENKNNHDKKQKNKEKNKNTTNISVNNQDNTDLYIKANEFLTQEQYQSAIDTLKQVQPATLRSITAIASCYNSLGQTDTAIDYYKQADKLSPNNTQILYSIGY